ncbi:hypothetical protein C8Q77DRAFT_665017 [Trametes polyzona]|nr:hypothetical protein C8Q77DRAFT_665017 [Trametes polyzona]
MCGATSHSLLLTAAPPLNTHSLCILVSSRIASHCFHSRSLHHYIHCPIYHTRFYRCCCNTPTLVPAFSLLLLRAAPLDMSMLASSPHLSYALLVHLSPRTISAPHPAYHPHRLVLINFPPRSWVSLHRLPSLRIRIPLYLLSDCLDPHSRPPSPYPLLSSPPLPLSVCFAVASLNLPSLAFRALHHTRIGPCSRRACVRPGGPPRGA